MAACSARRPVCVHPAREVPGEQTLEALEALERAYERLVLVLGLPAPLGDGGLGGSDALDAYLAAPEVDSEPVTVEYDAPLFGPFDRTSAFCSLRATPGPLLERAATLCLGEAIALKLDAAETPHVRRAFATELWWIVGAPTVLDLEAIDEVQSRPERSVVGRELNRLSEGSALLFEYLESTRGVGEAGTLSAALLSASAQRSDASSATWTNEPDYLDVLRHTFRENRVRTVSLFRDFCVARAFVGSRDDGQHLPSLAWAGDFGAARFDWVIPFSSLPRRVLLTRPIEPAAAVFLWVSLDHVPRGAALGFRAEWEAPVAFAWTLVRVASDGRELSRVDIPFLERASDAEGRVAELAGAHAIVIVGTYLDEVDLAYPLDPDIEPFEPHAATVYIAKL